MKKIKILIFIISLLMLTACSKNKNESYVSKSREVDSEFDKINVSNRSEREKLNKETETAKKIILKNEHYSPDADLIEEMETRIASSKIKNIQLEKAYNEYFLTIGI